ncbi:MAG: magnesium transporter CorA family protein [Solirubrobacterales bacterium]|nr:magnesium transporter CorA family protein [Solirubrobacterales bacterium]
MPNLPRLRRARDTGPVEANPAEPESTDPRVEEISSGGLRWINIESPGSEERAWLEENFDFHALDIEDVLSRNQRPKIDEYPDYLFLVVHVPVFDRKAKRLVAGEIDIFVGPDFMVTLPNRAIPPVEYLFERCRADDTLRHKLFARGSGYLMYRLVDDSFDYCFPMLRKIGNKLDALEDEIFEGHSEDLVRDLSNAKQDIINFRKVIRPQRPVLRDLENVKTRYLASDLDLEIYFDDIVDAHERIWDMLENYKEVVVALEETNESIISHKVNGILRVLTSISVIVLPLTLIASIFGMNVGLPGGGDPATAADSHFFAVVGVMLVILIGMVVYFRKRHWL